MQENKTKRELCEVAEVVWLHDFFVENTDHNFLIPSFVFNIVLYQSLHLHLVLKWNLHQIINDPAQLLSF